MKIQTEAFRTIIGNLLPAISKKDLVAQMSRIMFKNNIVGSFNDHLAISYPLELGGISCSVPAEDLFQIVSGVTEKEIDIQVVDGQMLLSSDSTNAEISTTIESKAVEDFYNSLDLGGMDWYPLPEDFLSKLYLVKFSTSNNTYDDQNKFCVSITKDSMLSGDGYRCTKIKCPSRIPETILLPGSSIDNIVKLSGITECAVVEGWIHFADLNDAVISSRIIKGKFPNMSKRLKEFPGGKKIKVSKKLIPILDNVSKLLAKDADFLTSVKIHIGKGETTVTGIKEGLIIMKTISNSSKEDQASFDISPIFLQNLLSLDVIDSMQIADNLAFFKGKGFQHLISLPII